MIKIRKDGQTITVPVSAFRKIYEPTGWMPVKKPKSQKVLDEPIDSENAPDEGAGEIESEELKKLDELVTLEQLKEFAMDKGIDVEGLTTRKSVRNAIKSALTTQTE